MVKILGPFFLLLCLQHSILFAQTSKVIVAAYDGILVAGYVDRGGFVNFTGPNVNTTCGNSKFILGMLPSLRFKEDDKTPRNSFVTPNLGFGFTYSYKLFAIQIPLYYNAKTATSNGNWQMGVGIGLRLTNIHSKNEKI